LPPVSSLSWAENEARFPVRFAKNRTSSVGYRQFNASPLSLLRFFPFVCPATTNKGSADHQLRTRFGHTPSKPSTQPQLIELVVGSQQTNFSL
jgi:hypothetical protein